MTTENESIAQQALAIYFDSYDRIDKRPLAAHFNIYSTKLDCYIVGWISKNIRLEDLGEYFYLPEDFDENGEFTGSTEFLIYYSDLSLFIGIFWDEFNEQMQQSGLSDRMLFNIVIFGAVTSYKASLE